MKIWKKISIFVILSLVMCMAFSVVAFAADAAVETSDKHLSMEWTSDDFGERAKIALQGTVTGMVMIFAVLGLLAVIMTLSKVIFYDIPNKKKEAKKAPKTVAAAPDTTAAPAIAESPAAVSEAADDGELAAVITAAIAAMLDSEEYKNEFVGGFRVVSFKRTTSGAWNRK